MLVVHRLALKVELGVRFSSEQLEVMLHANLHGLYVLTVYSVVPFSRARIVEYGAEETGPSPSELCSTFLYDLEGRPSNGMAAQPCAAQRQQLEQR